MNTAERIERICLLEKMSKMPDYSEKLGLKDESVFCRNQKSEFDSDK